MKFAFIAGRWFVLVSSLVLGIGLPARAYIVGIHLHGPGLLLLLVAAPVGALFLGAFLGTYRWRSWGRVFGILGWGTLLALEAMDALFTHSVGRGEALTIVLAVLTLLWFFHPEARSRFLAASASQEGF